MPWWFGSSYEAFLHVHKPKDEFKVIHLVSSCIVKYHSQYFDDVLTGTLSFEIKVETDGSR